MQSLGLFEDWGLYWDGLCAVVCRASRGAVPAMPSGEAVVLNHDPGAPRNMPRFDMWFPHPPQLSRSLARYIALKPAFDRVIINFALPGGLSFHLGPTCPLLAGPLLRLLKTLCEGNKTFSSLLRSPPLKLLYLIDRYILPHIFSSALICTVGLKALHLKSDGVTDKGR